MAYRTMLSKLEVRPDQIHRIRGEEPPEQAALDYEEELRASFGLGAGEFPRFNLTLLGLGDNVHVASLFPGILRSTSASGSRSQSRSTPASAIG